MNMVCILSISTVILLVTDHEPETRLGWVLLLAERKGFLPFLSNLFI